jgi:hypothetical protein
MYRVETPNYNSAEINTDVALRNETYRNVFTIRNLINAGALAAVSSIIACGSDYRIDRSGDAGAGAGGVQQNDASVDAQSGGDGGEIIDAGSRAILQITPFASTEYEASLYRNDNEEWTTLENSVQGETSMNQCDDVRAGDIIIIHVIPTGPQTINIPVTFNLSDFDADVVARGWDQTEFISRDVADIMVSNTGFTSTLPDLDPSAEGYRFNFVGQGAQGASTIYKAMVLQR